jgi:hypothetical protein
MTEHVGQAARRHRRGSRQRRNDRNARASPTGDWLVATARACPCVVGTVVIRTVPIAKAAIRRTIRCPS